MKARLSTVPSRSVLRRRPSSDRKSDARPRGSVPKRGRPSSRSATHQSCVVQRASKASQPAIAPFENRRGARRRTEAPSSGGCPAKGRETRVEPTDVYSCPPQEGGYSAREAPKADPRKTAYSESEPVFPFRESKGARTSEASARGCSAVFHARGLATRAATGQRTLAV